MLAKLKIEIYFQRTKFPKKMKKHLSVFCFEILVPITLFWLISNKLLGSGFFINFLDVYRPAYGTVPENTHTEKQLLHLEAENRKNDFQKKVLFDLSRYKWTASKTNSVEICFGKYFQTNKNIMDFLSSSFGMGFLQGK